MTLFPYPTFPPLEPSLLPFMPRIVPLFYLSVSHRLFTYPSSLFSSLHLSGLLPSFLTVEPLAKQRVWVSSIWKYLSNMMLWLVQMPSLATHLC